MTRPSLQELASAVRESRGFAQKRDIAETIDLLGLAEATAPGAIRVGDDCAAIPDGDGFLLFAIEGFVEDFVAADPYFAGHCGVMVNLSDIAAMGGRGIAIVDALWSSDATQANSVLAGLRDALKIYGVPVVGGHTNRRAPRHQLAVAVLGRAKRLITSFDAASGDVLIAAVDLRGAFRGASPYWDAASGAPPARLRADLDLLPELAEANLVTAGKDISMAGLIGTALMLAEASDRGLRLDVDAVPCPANVSLLRFLQAFPSFGFLLASRPADAGAVITRFAARGIACGVIGTFDDTRSVRLWQDGEEVEVWNLREPFIGCGVTRRAATTEAR